MEYDGKVVEPVWTTAFVDDVCNNRAHIVDPNTVKITWSTSDEDGPSEDEITDPRPGIL
eukprot:TRINITY_DN4654_c0_g1_i1.p1 TRINITY_DN4654_c0_g1~~TRINITY_DN4654_c0_g1_i1.p1  ORF type:complete len:59 (-),score=18.24 TRINITY_DN4654_c0_g1_i1:48-224(-)